MHCLRILPVALLLLSALPVSPATSQKAGKSRRSSKTCSGSQPFAYDNGPAGQGTWCGPCNDGSVELQAPINISSDVPASAQPPIEFLNYDTPTELNIYPNNPYNLKIDYSAGVSAIKIGNDTFKLKEFHFHRPSEEAINNRRYPMVLHLVHERSVCPLGGPGCAAVVAILIEETPPEQPPRQDTTALLDVLFKNFPPPEGKRGVSISVAGLLPDRFRDSGYYRYDGSLTTPPCTGDITFYLLKPRLRLSAEQIAQFERRYPSPNARDIQPLKNREIKNRK
ncbi:MAG TPA: carbonic anhydrase family protein [Candidatus Angelobacter sp.]